MFLVVPRILLFSPIFESVYVHSGTQFKTVVEYAPSQRVPKQWSKKDGREGTIYKGNMEAYVLYDVLVAHCSLFLVLL